MGYTYAIVYILFSLIAIVNAMENMVLKVRNMSPTATPYTIDTAQKGHFPAPWDSFLYPSTSIERLSNI